MSDELKHRVNMFCVQTSPGFRWTTGQNMIQTVIDDGAQAVIFDGVEMNECP